MRAKIIWNATPSLVVPIAYHQMLQGVVYRNIENNFGYSTFIHNEGYSFGQRRFRLFSFSHLMGDSVMIEKKLVFSGTVSFEVTSPDVYLIRSLEENIKKNGITIGRQQYFDVQVLLSNLEIESDSIIVKAISPITVYSTDSDTKKTRYYSPYEAEFSMGISDNFQRKYMAYYGLAASSYVEIEPVDVKKQDRCVTAYKGFYITAYGGSYRLSGPRKYLDFLYQSGVGAKNSQGFGMISLSK